MSGLVLRHMALLLLVFVCPVFSPAQLGAIEDKVLSSGGTVYVPIYSNIYSSPKAVRLELASMLSIRNTDMKYPITILKADYYNTAGKMIDNYVKNTIVLKPMESTHIYLKEYDKRGGPGANFIVKWKADKKVNQPIIEGVMFSSRHGISFLCPGRIIEEQTE